MSAVNEALQVISKIWYSVFGSSELKNYEELCLSSWARLLPDESRIRLEMQLERFSLIQRPGSGMKSVFFDVRDSEYSTWGNEILFSVRERGLKVFSGVLIAQEEDVQMKIKFQIFLHRGCLSSIEFESSPELMGKFKSLKVIKPKMLYGF